MFRFAIASMLAAGLALAATTAQAQTSEAPRQTRKAAKVRKPPAPAPAGHSINTPSTDFSKIERADGDERGPNGPTFRPTMGAGGMGVGGAF